MIPLWVIGAGGHAKVVIDTARASGLFDIRGCFDDRHEMRGQAVLGVPVVESLSEEAVRRLDVRHAVIAIGDNRTREQIAARFDGAVSWATVVHPFAHISDSASIGEGTVIFAGAVVQADTAIGRHVILNTRSSIDHDCRVDEFAHLGPGTSLAGGIVVERGAFLGVGSSVIPRRTIGAWSMVGGGAVVVHDVPPTTTVAGVPARVIAERE